MVEVLAHDFDNVMMNVHRRIKELCGYNTTVFLRMLHQMAGSKQRIDCSAAKRLSMH